MYNYAEGVNQRI